MIQAICAPAFNRKAYACCIRSNNWITMKRMKAILCKQYGPPDTLVLADLPPFRAGKGQVVVSIKAAGVNFPDSLIIQNKYQFKPDLPFIPGSECAGIVKEVGEG